MFSRCTLSSFKLLVGSGSSHLPTQHGTQAFLQLAGPEFFKNIQKVLNYIRKEVCEIYLPEINSSSAMSSLASVWSINVLCFSKYKVHKIYK